MPYDWKEKSEQEGPEQADKLPPGKHRVTVAKVVYSKRGGDPFVSRDGDPQIMLVFSDHEAREAAQMVTLSVDQVDANGAIVKRGAAWVLAKILSSFDPPANLARMFADGIEPKHFADPSFADKQLVGRKLTVDIAYERGKDGKDYARVTPLKPDPTSAPAPATPPPTADDAPPSTDDAPPPGMTKDEAWAAVVEAWKNNAGPDASKKRNAAWVDTIKKLGKAEKDMTSDDWRLVATNASIPF